jgi:hypothetical protein
MAGNEREICVSIFFNISSSINVTSLSVVICYLCIFPSLVFFVTVRTFQMCFLRLYINHLEANLDVTKNP